MTRKVEEGKGYTGKMTYHENNRDWIQGDVCISR
jgi:hypothetical protein